MAERMTPERARRVSKRWWWAGFVCLLIGSVLNFTDLNELGPLPYLIAALCMSAWAQGVGWAQGYRARDERERSHG